jgi:hypothetical protein
MRHRGHCVSIAGRTSLSTAAMAGTRRAGGHQSLDHDVVVGGEAHVRGEAGPCRAPQEVPAAPLAAGGDPARATPRKTSSRRGSPMPFMIRPKQHVGVPVDPVVWRMGSTRCRLAP